MKVNYTLMVIGFLLFYGSAVQVEGWQVTWAFFYVGGIALVWWGGMREAKRRDR